jgi:hypothetical protein
MLKGTTDAEFIDRCGDTIGFQKRGQLMASDFSFPILCWVSFLAELHAKGHVDRLLKMPLREFKEFIMNYKSCGVNGDDIVSSGGRESGLQWAVSFVAVGGVPSVAKSPFDREYFTINSQLWKRDGDGVRKVRHLLPAMLLGVCGKAHLAPDEAWWDFLECPIVTLDLVREMELDLVMPVDIPRSHGGLGLVQRDPKDQTWADRVIWCLLSKNSETYPEVTKRIKNKDGQYTLGEFEVDTTTPRFTGYVRRNVRDGLVRHFYGAPKSVGWKMSKEKAVLPSVVRKCLDKVPRLRIANRAARDLGAELCGMTYVHNLPVPELILNSDRFNAIATPKIFRPCVDHVFQPPPFAGPIEEIAPTPHPPPPPESEGPRAYFLWARRWMPKLKNLKLC